MKLLVFIPLLCCLFLNTQAKPTIKKSSSIHASGAVPCSTNTSSAWVDVILLIDTSLNMGSSQLRKISALVPTVLSTFTIGNNQYDMTTFDQSTRVAVVTYDYEAKIVANYGNINNVNDLTTILNNIQVSNTQNANLYDGFIKARTAKCGFPSETCNVTEASIGTSRPTAYVVFAASIASPPINRLIYDVAPQAGEIDTVITVNFNTADQALTSLLNNISTYTYPNITMYNFASSSNMLASDLTWAILQANCFCQIDEGIILVDFDTAYNRYTRISRCVVLTSGDSQDIPDNYVDLCAAYQSDFETNKFAPLAIASAVQETFIVNTYLSDENSPPFYIGLHKNTQGNWVWYDNYMNEYPATYFSWANGYPTNNNCTIIDLSSDQSTFVWKDADCSPQTTSYVNALCQSPACDASSDACGYVEYLFDETQQKKCEKISYTKRLIY